MVSLIVGGHPGVKVKVLERSLRVTERRFVSVESFFWSFPLAALVVDRWLTENLSFGSRGRRNIWLRKDNYLAQYTNLVDILADTLAYQKRGCHP